MDEQERLKLEDRLADVLRRDLSSIAVRPFAVYNDAARAVMVSPLRRVLSVARAGAVLAIVVLVALAAVFVLREFRPTPATIPVPSIPASASPSPSPATIAVPSPSPTAATTGAITGRFSYPSDFIPPVTVYAISVTDPNVFFFVDFAGYGNPPRPTLPPGVSEATYTITGIAPGTYYVVAYRNDGQLPGPAGYSQYTVQCIQATTGGQNSTPAPGCAASNHRLVPVTVGAGQTVSRIDMSDWLGPRDGYPPRPR